MATAITEDFGDAVLIVGGGLAGLAAALELTRAGERAVILDQEPEASLGGQAFWSYGGVFYVDSPYQRSLGIRDSYELARRDWFNSAQFDRPDTEDKWAIQWAEAYLRWVTDRSGLQSYLQDLGIEIFPTVSWAERGGLSASGHGNSVPRFHITWGTGPALVKLFVKPLRAAEANGLVTFRFRHKVDELTLGPDGSVVGATGSVLQPSDVARGVKSSRATVGKFVYRARAIVISTGGIGGNPDLIRQLWPTQVLGPCPENFVLGVPNHVDGSGLALGREAGGAIVNPDRLWFYTEGVQNWNPIWPNHGIRVISGPSPFWFDAEGKRMPSPMYPSCDTITTFKYILATGYDYTWHIMDSDMIKTEMALSGCEQNPELTNKSVEGMLERKKFGSKGVRDFMEHGVDWIVRDTLKELVAGMNQLTAQDAEKRRCPPDALKYEDIYSQIHDRDLASENPFNKDSQLALVTQARQCHSESAKLCAPHKMLEPSRGPLLAIRLSLLTRKTLGGLQTNLNSQVLQGDHETPVSGLYAAGEVCGFGGGGVHGKNALEGTFLTGCIHSGIRAGRALARRPGRTKL